MKNRVLLVPMACLAMLASCQHPVPDQRGNLILSDEETYGYLNCHMSDRGQWTAYALSQDGLHFHDLLCGDSIFSATEMAGIEGGTRDAYLCRKKDNSGFLMVTHAAGGNQDGPLWRL